MTTGDDATGTPADGTPARPDAGPPQTASLPDAKPPDEACAAPAEPGFPIVAIGASAGGVEALMSFFSRMPADSGCAFVVLMHLAPERESLLATLVGRATSMKVEQLRGETRVHVNRVYVAPPGQYVHIEQGRLKLRAMRGRHATPAVIDHFMTSLAADQGDRAIGVVLTGTDADGTLGIKAIKSEGGFVIAQSRSQAAHPGMPESALSTGMVDRELPIEEMPQALLDFAGLIALPEGPRQAEEEAAGPAPDFLSQILDIVRLQLGLDFRGYKTPMLLRRVRRRMALSRMTGMGDYVGYLNGTPAETKELAQEFLITVTEFFREPESWELLTKEIVPRIVTAREFGGTVRAWVPACASGEEAYSLAMLFLEHPRLADRALRLQVFATDIDRKALDWARRGRYPATIARSVSPQRLARFFYKSGSGYQVTKELREAVLFAPQNLISDPPFSHMDLVSCRNLLIYLQPDLQRRLLETLHFALDHGGYLVLGKSETTGGMTSMFVPVTHGARIYQRVGPPRTPAIRPSALPASRPDFIVRPPLLRQGPDYGRIVRDALVGRRMAAGVLVDRDGQALYYHGRLQRYLDHPEGLPVTDLFALLREQLRPQARAAVHKAFSKRERAEALVTAGGEEPGDLPVRIVATPVGGMGQEQLVLVNFERVELEPPATPADGNGAALHALENELHTTKRELRAAIEELESTNEELKVANEEAMSMNEELQSANEELETSKEELQSVNEELTTVNSQLQEKVNELEAVNDDLGNLLTSTHIPTLFLDRQLHIKRYTPAATRLFRLIPGDVNRPLSDIASQIDLPSLFADAKAVLERLTPAEQEIRTPAGEHYLRRVLPYRTQDDRIDGVVVTFVDITEIRRAVEGQRRFAAVMQASSDAIVVHDLAGRVLAWNRGAELLYGHAEADVLNKDLAALLPPTAREQHTQCLQRLLAGERIVGVDTQRRHRDGSLLDVSASYTVVGDGGQPVTVALIERDVSRQKRAEHELRESEQRFRTLADSAPVLVWMSRPDDAIEFANREFCGFTGLPAASLAGRRWTDLLHADDARPLQSRLAAARAGDGRVAATARLRNARGEYRWMKLATMERKDAHGGVVGLVGSMADIDAQIGAERALRLADQRKDEFLAMLGHELRNPLVPIRNAAEVLGRVTGDDARLQWVRDTLVRQVEHVTRLVDDLLDISLITRGSLRLHLEPVDLGHVIRRAVEAARPLVARKRHRFECTLPQEAVWVEGDGIRLSQVFENLLTNAAKYTDDGGEVSMALECDGRHAVVRVRDNGLGIAPGMHKRIFGLFVQDERSLDRSQGGLGIGLALVHHLVELHHGEVQARSEGIGKGCEFVVRLPLLPRDAVPAPVAACSWSTTTPRRPRAPSCCCA